jgi:hypothetical protein
MYRDVIEIHNGAEILTPSDERGRTSDV